jgi:GNAT superfamily N-acetyltransferase
VLVQNFFEELGRLCRIEPPDPWLRAFAHFEQERTDIPQEFLPTAETWLFESAGRVVGFISMLGNEVGGLFVAPGSHRKGIGRALMDLTRASPAFLELGVLNRAGFAGDSKP